MNNKTLFFKDSLLDVCLITLILFLMMVLSALLFGVGGDRTLDECFLYAFCIVVCDKLDRILHVTTK